MHFNIRKIREQRGMTQEELANKAGLSRASIVSYENNYASNITAKNLQAIANALNCKVSELFICE